VFWKQISQTWKTRFDFKAHSKGAQVFVGILMWLSNISFMVHIGSLFVGSTLVSESEVHHNRSTNCDWYCYKRGSWSHETLSQIPAKWSIQIWNTARWNTENRWKLRNHLRKIKKALKDLGCSPRSSGLLGSVVVTITGGTEAAQNKND